VSNREPEDLAAQAEADYFGYVWRLSDSCEKTTDAQIPHLGKRLPVCVQRLERLAFLLGRLGSCSWGCRGGDHIAEYLITRSVGTILSSFRCTRTGYYDQSITLTRSVGETANLFAMFHSDKSLKAEWSAADRKTRLSKFGPVRIRLLLESKGELVPIEEDRYRELSEVGVHPVPGGRPQDFSEHGRGQIGGRFQDSAVFVTVNELAYATCFLAFFGALNVDIEEDVRKEILQASADLYVSIGSMQITNWDETKAKLRTMGGKLEDITPTED
jgi:hypothetical protein